MRVRALPETDAVTGAPVLYPNSASLLGDSVTVYDIGYPIEAAQVATQGERIPFDSGWWDTRDVPGEQVYPDPSSGGRAGLDKVLGWLTGFAGHGMRAQNFDGRTLVPPVTRPNAAYGHVGQFGYSDKLAAGVGTLYANDLPDPASVARSFLHPNPLDRVMAEDGG